MNSERRSLQNNAVLQSKDPHTFSSLDVLRGGLAMIVCVAHSWQVFINTVDDSLTYAIPFGLGARFAVLCFFCLSGYVMAYSVTRNIQKYGSFNSLEYGMSRFIRIVPPLSAAIVLAWALSMVAEWASIQTLPADIKGAREVFVSDVGVQLYSISMVFTEGDLSGGLNGPLWSLQYEIQLYVILGLLAIVGFSSWWVLRIVAACALIVYWDYAFQLRYSSGVLSLQFLWYGAFASGVIGYAMFNKAQDKILVRVLVIGIALSLFLIATCNPQQIVNQMDLATPMILAQCLITISFTAGIVWLARKRTNHPVAVLGNFSYTLYIVHFPFLLFVYFILANNAVHYSAITAWGLAAISAVMCIVFSWLLGRLVENPVSQRAFINNITKKLIGPVNR